MTLVCRRLGQLITMAGIDQSSMPFSRPSTNGLNGTSNGAVTSFSTPNPARPSTEPGDAHSNMQAVPSKSDSQLQTKPSKIAFPQITPQNYVNSGKAILLGFVCSWLSLLLGTACMLE